MAVGWAAVQPFFWFGHGPTTSDFKIMKLGLIGPRPARREAVTCRIWAILEMLGFVDGGGGGGGIMQTHAGATCSSGAPHQSPGRGCRCRTVSALMVR